MPISGRSRYRVVLMAKIYGNRWKQWKTCTYTQPIGLSITPLKQVVCEKTNRKLRCGPREFRTCASWDQRGEVSTQAAAKLTGLMMWEGSGQPTGDYGIYVDLSRHNSASGLKYKANTKETHWKCKGSTKEIRRKYKRICRILYSLPLYTKELVGSCTASPYIPVSPLRG